MKTTRAQRDQWIKEAKDAPGELPLWAEAALSRLQLMAEDLNAVEHTAEASLSKAFVKEELHRALSVPTLITVLSYGSKPNAARHFRHRVFTALDLTDPLDDPEPVGSKPVPRAKFNRARELEKVKKKSIEQIMSLFLFEKERRMELEKSHATIGKAYAQLEKDIANTVRRIVANVRDELRAYADETE